jgi:hypothetical protein
VAPKQPWRVPLLGWGNQVIGVLLPIGSASHILSGLEVFSWTWARESIILTALLGLGLGYLNWSAGRAVLKRRDWAFQRTCTAAGMMIGYSAVGMLIFAGQGLDGTLLIVIRHGSENWWNWSLDHFQNSAIQEIPLLAWSVFSVGTVVRHRLPGAPARLGERLGLAVGICFCFVVIGGLVRPLHLGAGMLSSQR